MKTKSLLFSLIVTLYFFTACSNDDDNVEEKVITYTEQNVIKLKMYVGTPEGGKEANTDKIDLTNYFGNVVAKPSAEESIIFNKETLLAKEGDKIAEMPYIFNNDELWVASYYKWTYFGYGDKDQIIIPLNCIYSSTGNSEDEPIVISTVKKDFILEDAITESHFSLLSDMKSEKDTLIWYTTETIYNSHR